MNFLVQCPICEKTLQNPVILPCSHSICKSHVMNKRDMSTSAHISCPICHLIHDIPEKGFISNSIVEALLERKFDKIDLGPEHKVANKSFIYLKELSDEFKRMRDDPELEIDRVVSELRNKIDLVREVLKSEIDEESLKLIRELEEYERKRKSELSSQNFIVPKETKEFINELENDLAVWEAEINTFERNVERWREIHEVTIRKCKQLGLECEKMKMCLFSTELAGIQLKKKKFCKELIEPLM